MTRRKVWLNDRYYVIVGDENDITDDQLADMWDEAEDDDVTQLRPVKVTRLDIEDEIFP